MPPGAPIDYHAVREISAPAARQMVIDYWASCGRNVSATARHFGISRPAVYAILRKARAGDLRDRPRTPRRQPRKTPAEVEDQVIVARNKTHLGPKRLSLYLARYEGLEVPWATIRHIVRRNRHRLSTPMLQRRPGTARPFVDWYGAKPFEVVQIDLKYIRDKKALSKEQIAHLDSCDIPNFQWGALDVNSRFKLIAFSRERTWTNGLCFYLWTLSWLRSHGVTAPIAFTVDHGEEFGGKSWFKVQELRQLISGFGCTVIQNHKGHPEENAHLERSHRTDDEEFYIPRALHLTSEQELLDEAMGYMYYYNNVREHSSLDYRTPFEVLKAQVPQLDEDIRCPPPFLLDDVAVKLGPWSGYNVMARYHLGG
jgi:transposase-like protein